MTTILVQSEWGGQGLRGGEPSNLEPRTTEDTYNTIADVGVTIEKLHIVDKLAVWCVRLSHLQDNHMF